MSLARGKAALARRMGSITFPVQVDALNPENVTSSRLQACDASSGDAPEVSWRVIIADGLRGWPDGHAVCAASAERAAAEVSGKESLRRPDSFLSHFFDRPRGTCQLLRAFAAEARSCRRILMLLSRWFRLALFSLLCCEGTRGQSPRGSGCRPPSRHRAAAPMMAMCSRSDTSIRRSLAARE